MWGVCLAGFVTRSGGDLSSLEGGDVASSEMEAMAFVLARGVVDFLR
jgi:hypothetical protein